MSWKSNRTFCELDELLKYVQEVESQCLSKLKLNANLDLNDDYLTHKMKLFELYSTASSLLDELEDKNKSGIILEKLRLDDVIERMKREMEVMRKINDQNLHSFFFSKANKGYINKNDELDVYDKELLQIVISRYKKLFGNQHKFNNTQAVTFDAFIASSRVNNNNNKNKVLSKFESDKIKEWGHFTSDLEVDIKEIGNSATKVAQKARQLTNEARSQNLNIEEIKVLTEFTTNDVIGMNRRVQEIIGTSNNTTFCCRITLVILVFTSISIIIALTFKKLI